MDNEVENMEDRKYGRVIANSHDAIIEITSRVRVRSLSERIVV